MDLISKLEDLKNFGIDLKLDNKEMEVFYVKSMRYFFDEKAHLYCIQVTDRELEISSDEGQLATIYVKDSVLRIVPLDENPYAVVMDVLEFVANLHKPTIALYKELQKSKPNKEDFVKKATENVEKEEDSEENSDFDDDWI
jgi:hypothetical protein